MTKWYGIFQGHVDMDRGEVLLRQIEALRTYIFDRVIWYDYELVFSALLTGVAEAIIITRQGWAPDVDMAHYRCEMEAMSAFTGNAGFTVMADTAYVHHFFDVVYNTTYTASTVDDVECTGILMRSMYVLRIAQKHAL